MNEREYEVVAEFEEDNCIYIVSQPKGNPTDDDIKRFYSNIAKIIYS